MKQTFAIIILAVFGFIITNTVELTAQKKDKKTVVSIPAGEIKWEEMKGGPPGIMYSTISGDMTKGRYAAFIKLPAGSNHPLHIHTNDVKLVVISGTFWQALEGGPQIKLGPGSYLFVSGGIKHTSGVTSDADCVLFQESSGKFDLLPVADGAKDK
jgi:anti-sigma factor ChrR (cupin superfamily)